MQKAYTKINVDQTFCLSICYKFTTDLILLLFKKQKNKKKT